MPVCAFKCSKKSVIQPESLNKPGLLCNKETPHVFILHKLAVDREKSYVVLKNKQLLFDLAMDGISQGNRMCAQKITLISSLRT